MYQAIVARIQTRPHPNADRLQLGTVAGYQVVTSIDTEDGTLGVFFGPDGQLSPEMCEANDLIERKDPVTGARAGGYFGANRRVRAQRLRGEKSEGYWTPLHTLDFTGYDTSKLKEGDQFTELNGVPICNKYYTPATLKAMSRGEQRRSNQYFHKHSDTAQLKHEIAFIPAGSILYFTEKLHGTSGRFGYVLDDRELPRGFFRRLFRRPAKVVTEHTHLLGTRNTILKDPSQAGWYGDEGFRWKAVDGLRGNLHPGETLYFELVGWQSVDTPIMARAHPDDLKDIKKQYGEEITYTYGQVNGTCGLYVYRITQVTDDGAVIELSWPQVRDRCRRLGIEAVPAAAEAVGHGPYVLTGSGPSYLELEAFVDRKLEGPSVLDTSHPKEGVVVRVEAPDGSTRFLKAKSFTFGVMEGYLKNTDDYVDLEEAS